MENATKALLMAAGVLIALMILAGLMFMFNNLHNFQTTGTQNQREAQVVEFNNQYEPYNRNDVRGSDLYSLLNKVVDYNRRKSTKGTGTNEKGISDDGQYLAYQAMKIAFEINNSELTLDGTNRLFTGSNQYTVDDITNKFKDDIKEEIDKLEDKYTASALQNMCKAVNEIFVNTNGKNEEDKHKAMLDAVVAYNNCCKKGENKETDSKNLTTSFNDIQEIKDDVYEYYEYVQFKRAIFKCTKTEYNNNTGRITKMEFQATGKFN